MRARPIAAVTGASRGIGSATAVTLARFGYQVFALARSLPDLERLRTLGPNIHPIEMDIADDTSRRSAIREIFDRTDGYGVDVLVNNAGYGQLGPVEEVPIEAFRRQLEVNVIGLLAFTQPFLPGMRSRGHGRIVNISSAAGRVATPFMGPYNASKFALEGLSDAMRIELAPFGVRVVLIEPGPIQTEFGRAAQRVSLPDSPYARYLRGWNNAHGVSSVLERSADDVAAVILRSVEARHPHARYTITLSAKLATLARRAVPDRLLDRALSLAMKLGS